MRTDWLKPAGYVGLALALGAAGCKSNPSGPAPIVDGTTASTTGDPADANLVPGYGSTAAYTPSSQPARVLSYSSQASQQASGEQYPEQAAQYPQQSGQYQGQTAPAYDQNYDSTYEADQAIVDDGQQALYADQAPPPLPEYQQPELTDPGYEWTPGYWSYASTGYYWVPGAWVAPPYEGALWTPGYWGYVGNRYRFHYGFWGPHIGFYGGINYGYGYTGVGYHGGYWNSNRFYYNTQVNRVNVNMVRNVYVHPVPAVNVRISFNGPGGLRARPTPAEVAVYHERIVPPMHVQVQQAQAAAGNRQQFFAENHGRPAMAVATERFAADRTPPAALRPAPEVPRPALAARPAQPGQPMAGRPGQPEPGRPGVVENRPGVPENRPGQPEVRPGQPVANGRPAFNPAAQPHVDPAAQAREQQEVQRQQQMRAQEGAQRMQEGNRSQVEQRPAAPQPAARAPQPAPVSHPMPENRPQPQPAARPMPAPQQRAAPAEAPRPAPAQAPHPPAQAPHPAPAPAPHPAPAPAQHAAPAAPQHQAPPQAHGGEEHPRR